MAQDGIGDHGDRRLDQGRADGQDPEFPFSLGIHRVANADRSTGFVSRLVRLKMLATVSRKLTSDFLLRTSASQPC